jgi:hypothetical protein
VEVANFVDRDQHRTARATPPMNIEGVIIQAVGGNLNSDINWENHINTVYTKAKKNPVFLTVVAALQNVRLHIENLLNHQSTNAPVRFPRLHQPVQHFG